MGQNNTAPWQEKRKGKGKRKKGKGKGKGETNSCRAGSLDWPCSFLPSAPAAPMLYSAAWAAAAVLAAMWTWIFKNVWVQLLFWPVAKFFFPYKMHLKERKLWCSAVYDSTKLDWIQGTKKWHFFSSWVFFSLNKFKSLLCTTEVLEIAFESNNFFFSAKIFHSNVLENLADSPKFV